MPRGSNFYYQADPGAAIGASLAKALFGDPEAAAAQAKARAQMDYMAAQSEEARAHAGLYDEQTTGERIGNSARRSLRELKQRWDEKQVGAS